VVLDFSAGGTCCIFRDAEVDNNKKVVSDISRGLFFGKGNMLHF